MADGKACATCRYWEEEEKEPYRHGVCHRYPPMMLGPIVNSLQFAEFPKVPGSDWCGEYLPRKGKP